MKKEWMDKILKTGKKITVEITPNDVKNELYDICDTVHSSCDSGCPVYNIAKEDGEDFQSSGCPYFKNGTRMMNRLIGNRLIKITVNGKNKVVDFETANKILTMKEEK